MKLIYNEEYPGIDKNISDSRMGGRKSKGCRFNLWKRLFTDTIPVNKMHLTDTVSVNKMTDTAPVNKIHLKHIVICE